MPLEKLKDFLDTNKVKYVTLSHSPAYTSQEVAESAHISGKELAKTVMVKLDGKMTMVVLPASYRVDFTLLKDATSAKKIELASETEFKDMLPGCEVGAIPPFGNIYGMEVVFDKSLSADEEIAFNAGSHTELIKMSYADFERLVKPKVVRISHND